MEQLTNANQSAWDPEQAGIKVRLRDNPREFAINILGNPLLDNAEKHY